MKTSIRRVTYRAWSWEILQSDGTPIRGGYAATRASAINDCTITLATLIPDPGQIEALVIAAQKALHIAPLYSGGRPDVASDLRRALIPFETLAQG